MLLEVNANNLCPYICEMHWSACQLMFVFILSQNLSVKCSVFIFFYLSKNLCFWFKSFPVFFLGRYKETLAKVNVFFFK